MKRFVEVFAVFLGLTFLAHISAWSVELDYPQVIKTCYEAVDQKTGGNFVIGQSAKKYRMDSIRNSTRVLAS